MCHMNQIYNTQNDLASKIQIFLKKVFPDIRKTQLKIIPFIIIGMILSESVVASDIAKNLKDDFSFIQLDSVIRRIRRFFTNKLFNPELFYRKVILFVIQNYKKKHSDKRVHIIFDHMYSKDNYTVLLFSFRIGKQGIPLYFKCFKGIREPDAFKNETIIESINQVSSLFENTDFELIFLADRWFNSKAILEHINSLGHTFCIRLKDNLKIDVFDSHEGHYIHKYTANLKGRKYKGTYYKDVMLFDGFDFKTNIVISKSDGIDEVWIIATNGDVTKAIRDYSYRFGGIESLFKNQKSNGFYLESISNSSLESFTCMYTLLCFATLFLTTLGADYTKNSRCYRNVKISTHKYYKNKGKVRVVSLFNTGLLLFHMAYNSSRYIRIPFSFILYDI